MGLPEFQVFMGGRLFTSGPVSPIEKLWDEPDRGIRVGILATVAWSDWEFRPLYVFQPAVLQSCMLPKTIRVQDFLSHCWKITVRRREPADLALTASSDTKR